MLNKLFSQGFVVSPEQISLLHSPQDYKKALLELIAAAKHRILINCLYLENDESGQEVMQALKQAVEANPQLTIDIFLDFHRAQRSRMGEDKSSTNALWYYEELNQFNQQLVAQHQLSRNPINIYGIPCNKQELKGVYHLKGLVFDDTVLYTGASINNNYLAFSTYRQDRYQLIESAALAQSIYEFSITNFALQQPVGYQASALNQQFSEAIVCFNSKPTTRQNCTVTKQIKGLFRKQVLKSAQLAYALNPQGVESVADLDRKLNIVPLYGVSAGCLLNQAIMETIEQAQHKLTIYTPYFNFEKKFIQKLTNLCRKGVKVTIILSDKEANDFYVPPTDSNRLVLANSLPYLYELNLRNFLTEHQELLSSDMLQVYSWKDGKNSYHAKGVEVDNTYYIFTGSNLNSRSFNIDTENALFVHDPSQSLKEAIEKEYEFFAQHLTKLTSPAQLDEFKTYPKRIRKTITVATYTFVRAWATRLF